MPDLDLTELEEAIETPSDEQLKTISKLAERQLAAEKQVEILDAELTAAKQNLQVIRENLLPDAMRGCNLEMFKTSSGAMIEIKENIYASITEANRPKALSWLRNHNHGAIIKQVLSVPFTGADKDTEKELKNILKEKDIEYETKMGVHARTLTAWVKEQLRQDNEVPDSISYYEQRISKVVK